MSFPDVPKLRDVFIEQNIMLCFNGVFTATLIDEIGKALRNHMQDNKESPTAITDVFSVYIEMTQNIRHYTLSRNLQNERAIATIVVSRSEEHYAVSAGNVIRAVDAETLAQRIEALNGLDKTGLKAVFKQQLRQPRENPRQSNGAGLGLIDMARKAAEPMLACIQPLDTEYSFFSLRVIIKGAFA
ncbi:MAG: hypothetical protein HY777_12785 [Betaproteobacteria bacterium]|nr:hypothetical protein [Betaproteobacteria bacterium]